MMSTGPTSTGLQSQSSGEQPMVRTTMNAQKNLSSSLKNQKPMSLSLRAQGSHTDEKIPKAPSAQKKSMRRASPKIETFVPEKKHNFAIDFYSKTELEEDKHEGMDAAQTNDNYAK